MIVVDATVIADFLVGEETFRLPAVELARIDSEWLAPSIWRYELGNVLWKLARFGNFPEGKMLQILLSAETFVHETEERLDWGEVWALASKSGLSYYDASYAFLARSRGLKLRTRDTKLLNACPDVAEPMPIID